MTITIVAFLDTRTKSVAYRKFDTRTSGELDKAVRFYRMMLEDENVRVISTRKVKEND